MANYLNLPFANWTSAQLKSYHGPIFRATVSWVRDGKTFHADHEAPSRDVLAVEVRKHQCLLVDSGAIRVTVEEGEHTEGESGWEQRAAS